VIIFNYILKKMNKDENKNVKDYFFKYKDASLIIKDIVKLNLISNITFIELRLYIDMKIV